MELIKIKKSEGGKQIISARELYEFLEIPTDFTTWCKRMFEYGFDENVDYALIKNGEPDNQALRVSNPKTDYVLTLDCAKEIAMIQRSDNGKKARQYFIECEKKLKEVSVPQTYATALLEAGRLALELEDSKKKIEELQPKADFFDAVTDSKYAIEMGNVAKILDMGLGRNQLFEFLRSRNILMRDNVPYQRYVDQGLFRVLENKIQKPNGEIMIRITTLVFQKGIEYIRKMLLEKI